MDTCTIDGISFSYFFKAAPAVEWHQEPQHHTLVIEGHNVDGVPFDARGGWDPFSDYSAESQ